MAMPSPLPMGPVPGPFTFRFAKNLSLRDMNGALAVSLVTPADPVLAAELAADKPFSGTGDIASGTLQIQTVPPDKSIQFLQGKATVGFSADASAFGQIARYFDPADLAAALPVTDAISPMIFGGNDPGFYYLLLDWGYDAHASGNGKIALTASGSVDFGVDAASKGGFAVVRRFPANTGSLDAIQQLLDCWLLPAQIGTELPIALSADNPIPVGTWVIAETQGSVQGKLGVTYGFDFSWLREIATGGPTGLAGDIALKLQANVSAALGFEIAGKFEIVVSRPADSAVRLQVFKQRNKGWDFALNVNCLAAPSATGFPPNVDELTSAILGLHHQQILRYLQALEKWSKSTDPLPDTLARLGAPAALDLLKKLTGLDPATNFSGALQKLTTFLDQWTGLDQRISAVLWDLTNGPLAHDITGICQTIANGSAQDFQKVLNDNLPKSNFLASPQGQFLETLCMGRILQALDSNPIFQQVQANARTCLSLLSAAGPAGAGTLLSQLQNFLQQNVSVQALETQAFDKLEPLLKAKLVDLLDTAGLTPDHVQKIKDFLQKLEGQANNIYQKALHAVNSQYGLALSATYSSTSSDQQLLDVTFDLSKAGTAALLTNAIGGDFSDLLYSDHDGVSWGTCVFAHGLERHTHVDFRMPFYTSSFDDLNTAMASMNFVPNQADKTVSFQLSASDDVRTIVNSNSGSDSQMAIAAAIPAQNSRVLVHDSAENMSMAYTLKQAIPGMRRSYMQYQIKPYVQIYLPDAFGAQSSYDDWLGDMDKTLDQLGNHGTDVFGNTLLSLQIAVPSSLASAWLNAPANNKSPVYLDMSRRLQSRLKQLLTFFYFSDPSHFTDINSASPLIAYASLPASTAARLNNGALTLQIPNDVYWDWMDPDIRHAMLYNSITQGRLSAALSMIYNRLQAIPDLSSTAKFYQPNDLNIGNLLHSCDSGFGATLFQSLLFTEATLVHGTVQAAVDMGKFVSNPTPDQALQRIAKFGADITSTFNDKLKSVYGGDAVRPLGSALFIEAALSLAGDDPQAPQARAMLQATVVSDEVSKPDSPFHMPDYLTGQEPPMDLCLISQSLFSLGALTT